MGKSIFNKIPMKFMYFAVLSALFSTSMGEKVNDIESNLSHLDDIEAIEKFKWDKVRFVTRKDCSLDPYPDMRKFLEVESAHYPSLEVFISGDGATSRIE